MKYILVADVGGTNTRIVITEIPDHSTIKQRKQDKIRLLNIKQYKTKNISDFGDTLVNYLSELNKKFSIQGINIGAAGVLQGDRIALANNKLIIDKKDIQKKTKIQNVTLMNDFEALALGIQYLSTKDIHVLSKGQPVEYGVKAVIGAGTGLGKAILVYNKSTKKYEVLPSEGGHADLRVQSEEDQIILNFLRSKLDYDNPDYTVSYEELLSGRGLERLYQYVYQHSFFQRKKSQEIPLKLTAEEIMKTKTTNPCSQKTVELFVHYYAVCCRNFALEIMPRGGLYIAGGIAMNNPTIFDETFVKEFQRHSHPHYAALLKQIPIYLIINENVGLFGIKGA